MTQIKVLTGGIGQAVNPNEQPTESDYYKRKSEGVNWGDYLYQQWQAYNKANPPYPIINPGLAKEGETITGPLVWQRSYSNGLHWNYSEYTYDTADLTKGTNYLTRQAFLIDDTPKKGEKYPCTFELSKNGNCVGSVNDRCENCENRASNNNQPTEAKPFDAVEDNRQPFEKHIKLAAHIERMANTGSTGSVSEWSAFLRELNQVLKNS